MGGGMGVAGAAPPNGGSLLAAELTMWSMRGVSYVL